MKNFAYLDEIEQQYNNHAQGVKQVFLRNHDTDSKLTQFAYGVFAPGEKSGLHHHETMDEYFFITTGIGVCEIDSEKVDIKAGTFLRVPAKSIHNLYNVGDTDLKFVYFGIDIE